MNTESTLRKNKVTTSLKMTLAKPGRMCRSCQKPVQESISKKLCVICVRAKQTEKNYELTTKSLQRKKASDSAQTWTRTVRKPIAVKPEKTKACKTCCKPLHLSWMGKLCHECGQIALKTKQETKKEKYGRVVQGRKALKKKAEEVLHMYIRKQAADFSGNVQCYTCRKFVSFENAQAGHFRHGKLDLDERNLKACCVECNMYKDGELEWFASRLVEDYGREWLRQLNQDADRDTGIYTCEELEKTIQYYQKKLAEL